jgi:hypothetical protein
VTKVQVLPAANVTKYPKAITNRLTLMIQKSTRCVETFVFFKMWVVIGGNKISVMRKAPLDPTTKSHAVLLSSSSKFLEAYWKIRAALDPAIAFKENKLRTNITFGTINSSKICSKKPRSF